MLLHQIKVAQALLSGVAEGGRGTNGRLIPNNLKKPLNCTNLKVLRIVVVYEKY